MEISINYNCNLISIKIIKNKFCYYFLNNKNNNFIIIFYIQSSISKISYISFFFLKIFIS